MSEIKVNTRFGELSINPSQVITFPGGIPGFEDCTRWKLLHEVDEQGEPVAGIVVHLQALDDGAVSLSLTDPGVFGVSCQLVLTDDEATTLKLEDPNDLLVLMTLSAREEARQQEGGMKLESMYVNIAAPILINTRSRIGMQKIVGRLSSAG
ncbi:MAG: hypothetical protein A2Z95_01340 [Gallionellales bacterium GWA2_60_18]|nr:MAG: hypothetical protein A2Z95_01340 [Gallionellales bacterium GWA2_60_18]